jgi:hypothetical protein
MKWAYEMGSSAVMYTPVFMKIGSSNSNVDKGDNRQHGDRISPLLYIYIFFFYQNKQSRLKPPREPLMKQCTLFLAFMYLLCMRYFQQVEPQVRNHAADVFWDTQPNAHESVT